MNTPLWITSSLVLDARKAVWLPRDKVVAVADLHLGHADPSASSPTPASPPDEIVARLLAIVADYQPATVVLLGETIHPSAQPAAWVDLLRALLKALKERSRVVLVSSQPTPHAEALLTQCHWDEGVHPQWPAGKHLFLHGNEADPSAFHAKPAPADAPPTEENGRLLFGHEHPGITLGDGVATRVLCPCFLLAPDAIVLPAFSSSTPVHDLRSGVWKGALARSRRFNQVVAITAGRLLPVAVEDGLEEPLSK
ncbi:MAG TPA: hypothetical protein VNQ90_06740 [Chthoniobacteraceae bacterium]|nr:hypothetical protein [Chthoniobacteraceae bacterium]